MMLELHFQEGFSGEGIELLVDGEVRSRFTVATRYQIGLARIEAVELEPGQKMAIRLEGADSAIEIPTDSSSKYFVISKKQGQISVNQTDTMPGYL